MQSINEIQDEIVEEFAIFDDPLDQYEYIIDIGKQLPAIEERYKVDENLVHGCQSKVWLYPHIENGLLHYEADSNTVITKGIIALLIRLLSRQEPDEIINAELYCIDKINLRSHYCRDQLSLHRSTPIGKCQPESRGHSKFEAYLSPRFESQYVFFL